jgi:hypothetical protein
MFGRSTSLDGGKLGGCQLTPHGGGIQFGYDSEINQVIMVHPLTLQAATDRLNRSVRESNQK